MSGEGAGTLYVRYSTTSRIRTVVSVGDNLRPILAEQMDDYADRLRAATTKVGKALQDELRGQVRAAKLGRGLEKAWDRENYPLRKRSLRPSALVFSKATVLHDAFDAGGAVLPRRGRYLVIPLPAAIKRGLGYTEISRKGGRVPAAQKRKYSQLDEAARVLKARIVSTKPGKKGPRGEAREWRPYILLVPSRKSRSNLVALFFAKEGEKQGEPLFSLVRSTRVRKALDINAAAKKAEADLAAAVNAV